MNGKTRRGNLHAHADQARLSKRLATVRYDVPLEVCRTRNARRWRVVPEDALESLAELRPGIRVRHPQLGDGVIQERQGAPANPKLVILFERIGRRTLIAAHARLEIVLS